MAEATTDEKFDRVGRSLQNIKAEIDNINGLIGDGTYETHDADGNFNQPKTILEHIKAIYHLINKSNDVHGEHERATKELVTVFELIGDGEYQVTNDDGTTNKPKSINDNIKYIYSRLDIFRENLKEDGESIDSLTKSTIRLIEEVGILTKFVMMFGMFLEHGNHIPKGSMQAFVPIFIKQLSDEEITDGKRVTELMRAFAETI